jgi:hypothetical protein
VESAAQKLAFKYTCLVGGCDVNELADFGALEASYLFETRVNISRDFGLVNNHYSRTLHTLFNLVFHSSYESVSNIFFCVILIRGLA